MGPVLKLSASLGNHSLGSPATRGSRDICYPCADMQISTSPYLIPIAHHTEKKQRLFLSPVNTALSFKVGSDSSSCLSLEEWRPEIYV